MRTVVAILLLAFVGCAVGSRTLQRSVAIATSKSESSADAGSDVKEVLAKAFAKAEADGGNAESHAKAVAKDIGIAFAEAWARVTGTVFVEGQGTATSQAKASAKSQAEIFGKAIAGAVADATNGKNYAGSAVKAEDVASAIVQATVNVDVKLSTDGGFAKATSEAAARVVAEVVAEAIGEAFAFTVKNRAESGAAAVADVQANTKEDEASVNTDTTSVSLGGESTAEASGDAETQAKLWPSCSSVQRQCCDGKFINGDKCTATGQYIRENVGSVKGWKDKNSGDACRC